MDTRTQILAISYYTKFIFLSKMHQIQVWYRYTVVDQWLKVYYDRSSTDKCAGWVDWALGKKGIFPIFSIYLWHFSYFPLYISAINQQKENEFSTLFYTIFCTKYHILHALGLLTVYQEEGKCKLNAANLVKNGLFCVSWITLL